MYILIFNNLKGVFPIELTDDFTQVNIHEFESLKDESDYLYNSNKNEFFLNKISESFDNATNSEVKAIIIDKNLGGSGWSRAIGLAGHIACTNYTKCSINSVPIILTDWANINIEDPTLKDNAINNIFQTEGFYYRKYEELFSKKADNLTGELKYLIDFEINRLKTIDFKRISIKSVYDSSHQATNEWGAMRLASNFGVFELINFTYPKHLYFKYLSRYITKSTALMDNSLNDLFSKVLLIDDNADCGWVELLSHIHKCQVDKISSTEILRVWQTVTPDKFGHYDLIYLDLYLEKGKADSTNALSALKFIKRNFPHIPVIIFTASDKAWNLDDVLEKGADAMYIKESPLYYRDEEYSSRNYRDFIATIKYVYEKYKILRPYWIQISKIVSHESFKAIENSPRKLRDRIDERLRMFYGLLKKGYEQWDYDKQTFFYSDYELAFMTLWSVLNEIQEAHFEKSNISIVHSNGTTYHHHPDGTHTPLSRKQKWILKSNNRIFINNSISFSGTELDGTPKLKSPQRFEFQADSDSATTELKFDRRNSPYYSLDPNGFSVNDHILKSLHPQIAYIILNRMAHTNNQLEDLYRLSEIRNSLYLTHGDSIDSNFFISTERTKRVNSTITPEDDIKKLFDLVVFLLTDDPSLIIVF